MHRDAPHSAAGVAAAAGAAAQRGARSRAALRPALLLLLALSLLMWLRQPLPDALPRGGAERSAPVVRARVAPLPLPSPPPPPLLRRPPPAPPLPPSGALRASGGAAFHAGGAVRRVAPHVFGAAARFAASPLRTLDDGGAPAPAPPLTPCWTEPASEDADGRHPATQARTHAAPARMRRRQAPFGR
jgi:hypothetical protein